MVADKAIATKAERADAAEGHDLPSLVSRLADDAGKLLDTKLTLLKVEIKEEVDVYIRNTIMIAAGAVVLVIGFALLNIALAFLVSTAFATADLSQSAKYALGFVITGVVYLVIGTVAVLLAKQRLARQGIVPQQTVAELERDRDWIKNEL